VEAFAGGGVRRRAARLCWDLHEGEPLVKPLKSAFVLETLSLIFKRGNVLLFEIV